MAQVHCYKEIVDILKNGLTSLTNMWTAFQSGVLVLGAFYFWFQIDINFSVCYSMRIYPHQQDTGGFFIAVLQKKCQAPWENDKRCSTNPRLLPWETEADRPVSSSIQVYFLF